MMKKIKNGCYCVLYSPDYGYGWYTEHGNEALLYDPILIDLVESGAEVSELIDYCNSTYGDDTYLGECKLAVGYVPVRDRFWIAEYDGSEYVVLESDFAWLDPN